MIKARTRRIIQGADYSAQEPRLLSQLCEDEGMLQAYRDGKDLYVEIAAIAMHISYKECLEHFPKNCPIKQKDGNWYYAILKSGADDGKENFEDLDYSDINPEDYDYDKLADGETDTYKDGKERRGQAKKILLGIMYGRGEKSIAQQLGCDVEEARQIKDNVYTAFPKIKDFEQSSANMVRQGGFVTTLWGRKRRLPEYNLPQYSFYYLDENGNIDESKKVVDSLCQEMSDKLSTLYWKKKDEYIEKLERTDGIRIVDNNSKIAAASRQIINSRVQGCLDGNTRIQSKEYGIIKLKDYVNQTLMIWDGNEWTPGTIVSSGKKKKCIIYFEDGSQITCSPDHKFKVILKDGSFIWKKCSELTPEDVIDSFEGDVYLG